MTGTDTLIGRCVTCRNAFRHDGPPLTAPWCTCRADQGHPLTAVRWKTLTATTSTRTCNARCEDSTSPVCVCACGGRRHGATWATEDTTPAHSGTGSGPEEDTHGDEGPLAETRRVLAVALDECLRNQAEGQQ